MLEVNPLALEYGRSLGQIPGSKLRRLGVNLWSIFRMGSRKIPEPMRRRVGGWY